VQNLDVASLVVVDATYNIGVASPSGYAVIIQ